MIKNSAHNFTYKTTTLEYIKTSMEFFNFRIIAEALALNRAIKRRWGQR
jgi:hypothetical protein